MVQYSVGQCLFIALSLCVSLFSVHWLFLSLLLSPEMFTWQSPRHFLHSSPSLYSCTCMLAHTQMHPNRTPVPTLRVNSGVPQASWTVLLHIAGVCVCECIHKENRRYKIQDCFCGVYYMYFWSTKKTCSTEQNKKFLVFCAYNGSHWSLKQFGYQHCLKYHLLCSAEERKHSHTSLEWQEKSINIY